MNLALAQYSQIDNTNFEDVKEAVTAVRDQLDLLAQVFHHFDKSAYFSDNSVAQLQCLNQAVEFVLQTEKLEKRFMALMKRLKTAYDICCGSESLTQLEKDHVHFYLAVRSIVVKLTKGEAPDTAKMNKRVQEMITEALQSDGIEEIFKLGDEQESQIDIFDEDYLAKIEQIKMPNTKIKLLQKMLKQALAEFKKVNKTQAVDFSKKFQALVAKYNERDEKDVLNGEFFEGFTEELVGLICDLGDEMSSFDKLGIDIEEKAFYDILKSMAHKYDFDYPEEGLLKLATLVKESVNDKAKYTDWTQRQDIKDELKFDLIILLDENGYPPIDRDEVYKEIFEQAENFKKYSMAGV